MDRNVIINVLLIVIIIIGLGNFIAQFVFPSYTPDPLITGTFMGLAGIILGARGRGGDKK